MSTQKDKKIYARPCWAELPGNPSAGRELEQLFGLCAGSLPERRGNLPGWRCRVNQRRGELPGELTRTIYRVVVPGKLSASPNPDNMSIYSRGAGKPDE